MALLEVSHLSFSVPERTVLEGLDLTVSAGEIHALLGANGAGKSTLAYLIMGCEGYRPGTGEIRFKGQSLDALPMHERARLGITLAWQEPVRFEGLSVHDYLNLGAGRLEQVDTPDCLHQVGLVPDEYLRRMVDKTLSGGERKRIELASVIALNPELVILDEPTAGIDLLSINEIIDVICSFKTRGTAVLIITHHEAVTRIADRASLLGSGRILSTGDPEQVTACYQEQRPSHDK